MTRPGYTAVLIVLDRSGSMSSIQSSVVQSLRDTARDQAAAPGECTFDVYMFDDRFEYTHKGVEASKFVPILEPRGQTALYDAIVLGVTEFRERLDGLPDDAQPEFIQVVVATDGQENASQVADALLVRDTIQMHSEGLGWDFTFLGANQDAVVAGAALGFEGKKSMTFAATSSGVAGAASGLSAYIAQTRSGKDAGYDDSHRKAALGQH